MKKNNKGFTLVELLAVIVIMGILMMVAIPSVTRTIENSRKDTFVDIAKSYGNAARTLWTSDNLTCEGTLSSAVDDGNYYILINTKESAKDSLPVLLDQGGKSSWGSRDVNGYVRVNISTTVGKDTNGDGTYEEEPKRVTKFYVALSDGTHGLVDDNTLTMDELKRGNVVMAMTGTQLKKTELTVDDGKLNCGKDANGEYICTEVTPIKKITGICVDDQTNVEITGNYVYKYYSSLSAALSGSTETDAGSAAVGVYVYDNVTHIVLLSDTIESTSISISNDTNIDLNGYKLSCNASTCLEVLGGNVTIDGTQSGSGIDMIKSSGTARIANVAVGATLTVNKGTYTTSSNNASSSAFYVSGTMNMNDATIKNSETGQQTIGVEVAATGNVDLAGTTILSDAVDGQSYGIVNNGKVQASNTKITAVANYGANAAGYTAQSRGIRNMGELELNNCYAIGTHSGVTTFGNTTVNGGVYESYGHGGFYLAGPNATYYIANATMKDCDMPSGYVDTDGGTNQAALYIGGAAGMDNITAYIDNCTFQATRQPIVLRGSSGEKNNTLYISNSNINLDYTVTGIRIDNDTHKAYIGAGNNFTENDANRLTSVIKTNEVYKQN